MSKDDFWSTSPDRFKLPNCYHVLAKLMGWEESVRVCLALWNSKWPKGKDMGSHRACVYIPKKFDLRKPPVICAAIGEAATRTLIAHFPGENFEFHGIGEATLWRRDAGVVEQSVQYSRAVLSARFGISKRHIGRILAIAKSKQEGTPGTKRCHLPSPISNV